MQYFMITDIDNMTYPIEIDSDIVTADFLVSFVTYTKSAVPISKDEYDRYINDRCGEEDG